MNPAEAQGEWIKFSEAYFAPEGLAAVRDDLQSLPVSAQLDIW